jgi:hypothetical protein
VTDGTAPSRGDRNRNDRRLMLLRLTCGLRRGDGGGAVAVGGDQLGDLALIETLAQAPRPASRSVSGHPRAGERYVVTKRQVSSVRRVRVSGKYLHQSGSTRTVGTQSHGE